MEKVININFQGRVIAIEEPAYDALKQYIDALRNHFASEESSEEIIGDIENRIAELLSNRLRQGAVCINSADLNAVIDSIGRLEDIMAAEGDDASDAGNESQQTSGSATTSHYRLFRNADDKVIAGVCSGLAIRMNIDPIVVRILFVVLSGALFWIYILLWIIVPVQSFQSKTTKRLFRSTEDKVLAGVCGGLGTYFGMEAWKVRVIFLLPFIASAFFGSMDLFESHLGWNGIFTGSFGSTAFILYVILWLAVPYASSATDKMEMRGEKIDINSIKAATQARTGSTMPPHRPTGSGLGRIVGILLKAFLLFIAGSVALGFFGALIGLVFAGTATMPYTDFFIDGANECILLWTAVGLTLGTPLIALIVWIIRRLMGVRTSHHFLAYVFFGLWVTGIVCALYMTGTIVSNFSTRATVEDVLQIEQPSTGHLYLNVSNINSEWHATRHSRWFADWDDDNDVFHIVDDNLMWINTVQVNIEQSADSLFHAYETRASRGRTAKKAKKHASNIVFDPQQLDSVITLPRGFTINKTDKFRNQQVIITIEVPMGKSIQLSDDIDDYNWFDIEPNGHRRRVRMHWKHGNGYGTNKAYIMTPNGLKARSGKVDIDKDSDVEVDESDNEL